MDRNHEYLTARPRAPGRRESGAVAATVALAVTATITATAPRVAAAMVATLIAAVGGGGTGCSGGSAAGPLPPGDAARGAGAFAGSCAPCHGPRAEGIAETGMDLRQNAFVRNSTPDEIARFIRAGHPPTKAFPGGMPADGGDPMLGDQTLADIVAWLKSLNATPSGAAK